MILAPQDKRNVEVTGYVVLHVKGLGSYTPKGVVPWAKRVLKDGRNVVNRNQVADWKQHDEGFAKHLKDGAITVGDSYEPMLEVVRHNEKSGSSRERELEDRIARLEALLEQNRGKK